MDRCAVCGRLAPVSPEGVVGQHVDWVSRHCPMSGQVDGTRRNRGTRRGVLRAFVLGLH